MSKPLRILYVEDSEIDAELVIRELFRAGFDPSYRLVLTEADFLAGLDTLPDLILSDYALPQFDGMRALFLLQERKIDIPFILISGTLGEEAAVTSIKHGAADYLMKDRLSRLGSAVERVIDEHRLRTERKQAEAALIQSEACLRIVSNFARIGFGVVNSNYRFVFANAAFAEIFRLPSANITGIHFFSVLPVGFEEQIRPRLEKGFLGERAEFEFRLPGPKGQFHYLVNCEPVLDGTLASGVSSVVVVVMDITSRRNTEEQLRQSQKMEAVGQLAGGIAHDFNNMLTVISTYTSLLLDSNSISIDERYFVNEIGKASERAADLTARLLAFSRGQMRSPEVVNLNEMIVDSQKLLELTLGRRVEISLSLQQDLHCIWMDRIELSQILMNLSINARDAMLDGGRLEIRTQNVEVTEGDANGGLCPSPGSHVLLTVSDTGCGMTEVVKRRIFEPFFSTKPIGKGTGLGLAIVHGIVSRSGGSIQVSSETGKGTKFGIYFPKSLEAKEKSRDSSELPRTLRGTELILLVDDDDFVRKATHSILTEYGYRVIEAENGNRAIQAFQEQPNAIQLVITDQVMPEMLGAALVENIERIRPGIPILLISGYIADDETRRYLVDNNVNYLQKPFHHQSLARKVRDALDLPAKTK